MSDIQIKSGARHLPASTCRMCCSVNSASFEGAQLKNLIDWTSATFPKFHIVVADTLQRFNAPNPKQHELAAKKEGDAWLAKYQKLLQQFQDRLIVSRWDDWRRHPDFKGIYNQLREMLASNPEFERAVESDIEQFQRRLAKSNKSPTAISHEQNIEYILEELSVVNVLERHVGGVEIYPGSQLKSGKFFTRIARAPQELALSKVRFVELRFQQRKEASGESKSS